MSAYHKDKIRINHILDAIELIIRFSENKIISRFFIRNYLLMSVSGGKSLAFRRRL